MGIFRMMKEAKQATKLENEVKRRIDELGKVPVGVTQENLSLQIFVMESDIERYSGGKFYAKDVYGNMIDWQMTIKGLEGMVSIYDEVMQEGIEKWTDKDFLEKKFIEIDALRSRENDKYQRNFYTCQLKAVAGLQEGQLYYSWSSISRPIDFNPAFLEALRNRHLLYV